METSAGLVPASVVIKATAEVPELTVDGRPTALASPGTAFGARRARWSRGYTRL